jgi:hypothetical protein
MASLGKWLNLEMGMQLMHLLEMFMVIKLTLYSKHFTMVTMVLLVQTCSMSCKQSDFVAALLVHYIDMMP